MKKMTAFAFALFTMMGFHAGVASAAECVATVTGPTFGFNGLAYFKNVTTCDVAVPSVTINATAVRTVTTPPSTQTVQGSTTCTNTKTCTLFVNIPTVQKAKYKATNSSVSAYDTTGIQVATVTWP